MRNEWVVTSPYKVANDITWGAHPHAFPVWQRYYALHVIVKHVDKSKTIAMSIKKHKSRMEV